MEALEGAKGAIERIILDPRYHDLLTVLKGARNGAVYGSKVRFPHALVMIFLFRSGTFREKLGLVLRATRHHARNLAKFATTYKLTMLALKYLSSSSTTTTTTTTSPQGKAINIKQDHSLHPLIAGALGGYLVFGVRSTRTGRIPSVNMQIVIYVFARVVLALAALAAKPGTGAGLARFLGVGGGGAAGGPQQPHGGKGSGGLSEAASATISHYAWPVFASASWGLVMWLFRWHPAELQGSLRSSMVYIYGDSDEWDSLRTLLWHNK